MNEVKQEKTPPKNKKLGADGLSKKERRAQKVQQTKTTAATNEQNINRNNNAVNTITPVDNKSEAIAKPVESQPKEMVNGEGKTKAQLKAERKAQFEKQWSQQQNAKAAKTEENLKEKGQTENKEKSENAPSKAQIRAERRALQEKQREAKATTNPEPTKPKQPPSASNKENGAKKTEIKKKAPLRKDYRGVKKHPHLQMVEHMCYKTPLCDVESLRSTIHPAFVELGVRYAQKSIVGANSRCLGLLEALKLMLADYFPPTNQEFCRAFEVYLQKCVDYLNTCRPISTSMMNTLRYFKVRLLKIDTNLTDSQKRADLMEIIDMYIKNDIEKAAEAVSLQILNKIANGDVILTYGCSSLIEKILIDADKKGKKFTVVVADLGPYFEGKTMLVRLTTAGIACNYVSVNSISHIMCYVTKVLLGAHSLLWNGSVMFRAGAAQVALVAKDYSKPVLICCETYKFCERVQLDAYVFNEISDSYLLLSDQNGNEKGTSFHWKGNDDVIPFHLTYDVVSSDFVSAVVTELRVIPCTSVPVMLRCKPELTF